MISIKCPGCDFAVSLGPATCEAVIFEKAIGFSYLRIECPRAACEAIWCTFVSAFVDDDDYRKIKEFVGEIQLSGIAFELGSSPGPNVLSDWAEAHDEHTVDTYGLGPSQEDLIEALRFTLENTPHEHLMDIFSSPPPKSKLPFLWP